MQPERISDIDYSKCAEHAFALMRTHHVEPLPEHYAVWFHYVQGKNPGLVTEVDNIIRNGLTFTGEVSSYLYNKFIVPDTQNKAVDDAASSSEKVLIEVLKVINAFSDETQSYNKSVDGYLGRISEQFENNNIKTVVKELIGATAKLKESGKKLTAKLEESTNEINALKKDLEHVTMESQRDFLTGAFNRKTFEKYADEQLIQAKQTGASACLMMIDIDHFKRFNDRFGHLIGDEVLKTVARTLISSLKGQDMVARFGGEEFVVILPSTPIEGAFKVAETIRNTIATKQLKRKDTGESFGVITVSMGISAYHGESDSLLTLIKRADEAMYESKKNGRNQVTREVWPLVISS